MDRGVMSWLWSDVEEYLLKVGYPPSLAKACTDDCFYYAMCLKNGVIIEFEGAVENGEWIHIPGEKIRGCSSANIANGLCFERGIDIRVSEILWCADAPRGS